MKYLSLRRSRDLHEGCWEHGPTVEGDAKNQKLFTLDGAHRAVVGCVAVLAKDSPNKPAQRSRLGVGQLVCHHHDFVILEGVNESVFFILREVLRVKG